MLPVCILTTKKSYLVQIEEILRKKQYVKIIEHYTMPSNLRLMSEN